MLTRRGFLKSLLAAPVVALAPSLLWVPPEQPALLVPEVAAAMEPVIEAAGSGARMYGYVIAERYWRDPLIRAQFADDAERYFPLGADVIIVPGPLVIPQKGMHQGFARFAWHGTGQPILNGDRVQIAQHWRNGEELEPQLWLA